MMESVKGRKSRICCCLGDKSKENDKEHEVKNRTCCRSTQLLASFNYCLLLIYAAFILFAMRVDPQNEIFMTVCLVVGCVNIGTCMIGNVGVFLRIDSAVRGSFTLLILEHVIGFIIGSLLLIESLTTSPLTEFHHGAKVAAFFLTRSRYLAIGLACAIIFVSFLGCYTLTSVAEWQTELEADRYAKDHHETESLLRGEDSRSTSPSDAHISPSNFPMNFGFPMPLAQPTVVTPASGTPTQHLAGTGPQAYGAAFTATAPPMDEKFGMNDRETMASVEFDDYSSPVLPAHPKGVTADGRNIILQQEQEDVAAQEVVREEGKEESAVIDIMPTSPPDRRSSGGGSEENVMLEEGTREEDAEEPIHSGVV